MKTVDMRRFLNGGLHLIAGTYGRSIYRRDIKGDEISGVADDAPAAPVIANTRAFPNPFNATTTIGFELGRDAEVRVEVFDLAGRRVVRLKDALLSAGAQQVQWDGLDRVGSAVASGTYLVVISAGEGVMTQKVVLAK